MRRLAVLLAGATLLASGCAAEAQIPPERPNVVFVLADDMRADEFGRIEGFRRLAAEGVTFENAFVTNSVCCPSRTTALTGRYSHNHGVMTNASPDGGYAAYHARGIGASTLATWLQDAGYRTGLFGKFLNGYGRAKPPEGFDRYEGGEGPDKDSGLGAEAAGFVKNNHRRQPLFVALWVKSPHGPLKVNRRFRNTHLDETLDHPPSFNEEDLSDKAAWLRERPFITPEEEAAILEARRKRLQMLEGANLALERTLDAFARAGELENTFVVFSSDNGYTFGEHRLALTKSVPYEESIHVPLVITGPGVPQGIVRDELVVNNDLAPTIAGWAGVDDPEADGRSLEPLLSSEEVAWRGALLTEHPGTERRPGHAALRTREVSYIEWETGERELYRLGADPNQLENVAASVSDEELNALHDRLEALESCAGEACRMSEGP
jgi:N-acetylglucosamine-6-sulfatase